MSYKGGNNNVELRHQLLFFEKSNFLAQIYCTFAIFSNCALVQTMHAF